MPGGLADVLPSALSLLGLPDAIDRLALRERLGDVDRIVVLLIDGLGYHLLPTAAPVAPFVADVLAGRAGRVDEISCGFPSTTPTSLVTFGTGAAAGAHGVLGFTVAVPGTERVLVHVDWRGEPDPRQWQPVPTLFRRAGAAGIATAIVTRPMFEGSGLTVAAYDGARFVPAERSQELAERVVAEVRAAPGLVYGYHPTLDTAAHLHGIDSAEWRRAAASVDRLISRVAEGLPPNAGLVVTADHGALDVPAQGRFDVGRDERLSAGVRQIAGEPRVRYVHTVAGATDDVMAAWRDVLGGAAQVVSRDEAVAADWFGPVAPQHVARIGDVVAVCRDRAVVLASGYEPDRVGTLVAFHGAMTPAEVAIPLITVRGG